MINAISREAVYLFYYLSAQMEQIAPYWALGIVLGSVVSVFGKERIHSFLLALQDRHLGLFGIIPASLLGIASPLCMYGTIPIAASFSSKGMRDDWLAAFMMSSMLLNPQLLIYSAPSASGCSRFVLSAASLETSVRGMRQVFPQGEALLLLRGARRTV